jgi:hypothetical protein
VGAAQVSGYNGRSQSAKPNSKENTMSPRGALAALVLLPAALLAYNPVPKDLARVLPTNPVPKDLVTVKWTGEVTVSGISIFKKGDKVTGSFTYDRKAKGEFSAGEVRFPSPYNAISITVNGTQFVGTDVWATIEINDKFEALEIVSRALVLPDSWKELSRRPHEANLEFDFVNFRKRGVLTEAKLPGRDNLDLLQMREAFLRISRTTVPPGGVAGHPRVVEAKIMSLE